MEEHHHVVDVFQEDGGQKVCSAYLLMGTTPVPGHALLGVKEMALLSDVQVETYKGLILHKTTEEMEPFLWPISSMKATCGNGRELLSFLKHQLQNSKRAIPHGGKQLSPVKKKPRTEVRIDGSDVVPG